MKAIPNKIVIGENDSPILTITNENIESVSEETAVSLIGDELFIDQFVPIVKYSLSVRYVFAPSDYDSFITSDGLVMCGHYEGGYDLRKLPYGTKITFYSNNSVSGIFYCENVERTGKELFKINCISAIGLMNNQRSKGGIYTGQTFETVLREIVGDEYEYIINEDVASLNVYGWLPYSTRRRNLHQLIMAYGVNIVRADDGQMLFTFLTNTEPQAIPSSRIYAGGKVVYNEPASRVEVVEHAYHYVDTVIEETLFDNTQSDVVSHALITFDKPVYVDSLRVLDGGDLTISSAGVNHAVVSGTGVLVGKPYVHTTKVVSEDNEEAGKEKVVRVEEATLVTLVNSENVLARLVEYYFNATTVENSIVVESEKCGRRYDFLNAFHEHTSGFLSKMSMAVSSIRKASCEFIQDYIPKGQGNGYTQIKILSEASGTWTVPEEVFEKVTPNIRIVLIGGGESGTAGSDGEAGADADDGGSSPASGKPGEGGAGGVGGKGGAGGKVYSTTIDCTGITKFSYLTGNSNTFFGSGNLVFNSDDGITMETGYLELFSGTIYALPGHAGQNGGKGGKGGFFRPGVNSWGNYAENGEAVTYNGYDYHGGVGGSWTYADAPSETNHFNCGGGGGSGAAVGYYGEDGGQDLDSDGGDGANAANADPTPALYGCGGNGGHGGGGGGGGGLCANFNEYYESWVANHACAGGAGGTGSAGTEGYQGCAIIYF